MSRLTEEQINFIVNQVSNSQIESEELKEGLIDHLCCVIEDYTDQGKSFEEYHEKAIIYFWIFTLSLLPFV